MVDPPTRIGDRRRLVESSWNRTPQRCQLLQPKAVRPCNLPRTAGERRQLHVRELLARGVGLGCGCCAPGLGCASSAFRALEAHGVALHVAGPVAGEMAALDVAAAVSDVALHAETASIEVFPVNQA